MTDEIVRLVKQAEAAANSGRWDVAEKLWADVRRRDPNNPRAAFSLGIHAMQRRDFANASMLIEQAHNAAPRDPFILLTLSKARRENGDSEGEGQAIEQVLAIDPYYLPALLAKANRLERLGNAILRDRAGFEARRASAGPAQVRPRAGCLYRPIRG